MFLDTKSLVCRHRTICPDGATGQCPVKKTGHRHSGHRTAVTDGATGQCPVKRPDTDTPDTSRRRWKIQSVLARKDARPDQTTTR